MEFSSFELICSFYLFEYLCDRQQFFNLDLLAALHGDILFLAFLCQLRGVSLSFFILSVQNIINMINIISKYLLYLCSFFQSSQLALFLNVKLQKPSFLSWRTSNWTSRRTICLSRSLFLDVFGNILNYSLRLLNVLWAICFFLIVT